MTKINPLEVLKQAILLERRGEMFYRKVADESSNSAVKEFFNFMAEEEKKHIQLLSKQFKAYHKNQVFEPGSFSKEDTSGVPELILDGSVQQKISAASFEAASIEAAVYMEKRAIDIYSDRAANTEDPVEKEMYQWLADWEQGHLRQLVKINEDLIQSVWADNSFWPF